MTLDAPKPTAPPYVIVRVQRARHLVGQVSLMDLTVARPWLQLTAVRRLYAWPSGLGLDGLAVAAGDVEDLAGLQLGPAVPRHFTRDVEAVWWTTPAAAAAIQSHPDRKPEDPARPLVPLVAVDGSGAPITDHAERFLAAAKTESARVVGTYDGATTITPAKASNTFTGPTPALLAQRVRAMRP